MSQLKEVIEKEVLTMTLSTRRANFLGSSNKKEDVERTGGTAASLGVNTASTTAVSAHKSAPQVVFAVADLKITDGKVKFLEFGDAFLSGFYKIDKFREAASATLKKLGLPLYTHTELQTKPNLFKQAIKNPEKWTDFSCVQLLFTEGFDFSYYQYYQLQGTDVLLLNNSPLWKLVSLHKNLLPQLFSQAGCQATLPRTQNYWWNEVPVALANRIKQDIPNAKAYVFKAPNSANGLGVFVVSAEDLEQTIPLLVAGKIKETKIDYENKREEYKKAFKDKMKDEEIKANIDRIDIWRIEASKLPRFVVQEYCASDPLNINGKAFDATMRVGFLITIHKNEIEFFPLASYWKYPESPINDSSVSICKRTISKNVKPGVGVCDTDGKIQAEVFGKLASIMTKVFAELCTAEARTYIESLIYDNDHRKQLEGALLALQYVAELNNLCLYSQVLETLKLIKTRVEQLDYSDVNIRYYEALAEVQLFTNKAEDAIKSYSKAIEYANASDTHKSIKASFYIGRSMAFSSLGRTVNATSDLYEAEKLGEGSESLKFSKARLISKLHGQLISNSALTAIVAQAETALAKLPESSALTLESRAPTVLHTSLKDYQQAVKKKNPALNLEALELRFYNPPFHYENASKYGFLRQITVSGNLLSLFFRGNTAKTIRDFVIVDEKYHCQVLNCSDDSEFHRSKPEKEEPHYHLYYNELIKKDALQRLFARFGWYEIILRKSPTIDATKYATRENQGQLLEKAKMLGYHCDITQIPIKLFCFSDPELITDDDIYNLAWLSEEERNNCLQVFSRYMGLPLADSEVFAERDHKMMAEQSMAAPRPLNLSSSTMSTRSNEVASTRQLLHQYQTATAASTILSAAATSHTDTTLGVENLVNYSVTSLSPEQRKLIEAKGGKVIGVVNEEIVFKLPPAKLASIKNGGIREALGLHREKLSHTSREQLEFLKKKLEEEISCITFETDSSNSNCFIITYEVKNKERVEKIIAEHSKKVVKKPAVTNKS